MTGQCRDRSPAFANFAGAECAITAPRSVNRQCYRCRGVPTGVLDIISSKRPAQPTVGCCDAATAHQSGNRGRDEQARYESTMAPCACPTWWATRPGNERVDLVPRAPNLVVIGESGLSRQQQRAIAVNGASIFVRIRRTLTVTSVRTAPVKVRRRRAHSGASASQCQSGHADRRLLDVPIRHGCSGRPCVGMRESTTT